MSTPKRKSTKSPVDHWFIRRDLNDKLEAVKCEAHPWGHSRYVIDYPIANGRAVTRRRVAASAIVSTELQAWQKQKGRTADLIQDAEEALKQGRADLPQILAAIEINASDAHAKAEGGR